MSALSPEAQAYGADTARKLLRGRKGHGGGPCLKRNMNEAELTALCAIAFNAGRTAMADPVARLVDLAERLTASGEIGDGMVAEFHAAAARVRGQA